MLFMHTQVCLQILTLLQVRWPEGQVCLKSATHLPYRPMNYRKGGHEMAALLPTVITVKSIRFTAIKKNPLSQYLMRLSRTADILTTALESTKTLCRVTSGVLYLSFSTKSVS